MIPLRSLGGGDGAELAGDLALLAELPVEGRRDVWRVLGPALAEPIPPGLEALGREFAAANGADHLRLARGLRALRHVVLGACRRNLGAEDVALDLAALGTDGDLARAVLARFEEARRAVRERLLQRLLLEHGSVLRESSWRTDAIVSGKEGAGFRAPVTLVTLVYESGGKRERLTLQVTPDGLSELHETIAAALAELPRGG